MIRIIGISFAHALYNYLNTIQDDVLGDAPSPTPVVKNSLQMLEYAKSVDKSPCTVACSALGMLSLTQCERCSRERL